MVMPGLQTVPPCTGALRPCQDVHVLLLECRLYHEAVFGFGGARMLRALGHAAVDRFHMDEGHAASLHDKLAHVVLPPFHSQGERFIDVMPCAVALSGSLFNTRRMVQQDVLKACFDWAGRQGRRSDPPRSPSAPGRRTPAWDAGAPTVPNPSHPMPVEAGKNQASCHCPLPSRPDSV